MMFRAVFRVIMPWFIFLEQHYVAMSSSEKNGGKKI
jgi:hypothetical protein